MAKQMTLAEVLATLEANRDIAGRKLVAAMIEEGLFRITDGQIRFAGQQQINPRRLTRVIWDTVTEMLIEAYREDPQHLIEQGRD